MKKIGILIFVSVLFFSCKKSQDAELKKIVEDFQQKSGLVFFQKDSLQNAFFPPIDLLEKTNTDSQLVFFQKQQGELRDINRTRLSEDNRAFIGAYQEWISLKENDTSNFNIFSILKNEVSDSSQTNEDQFSKIINRLEEVPLYFSKAKQLIKKPFKARLENAIAQYSVDYFYLKNELPLLIRKPDILKEDQINFSQKNKKAQIAVKDFIAYLNSHLFEINEREMN